MKLVETKTTIDFVYSKEEILKFFADPEVVSWSQVYEKLGFNKMFEQYYADYGSKIDIDKIRIPEALYSEIYDILKEHVLTTKNKHYKMLRPKYKLSRLAWDMLAVAPSTVAEGEFGLVFSYPKKVLD